MAGTCVFPDLSCVKKRNIPIPGQSVNIGGTGLQKSLHIEDQLKLKSSSDQIFAQVVPAGFVIYDAQVSDIISDCQIDTVDPADQVKMSAISKSIMYFRHLSVCSSEGELGCRGQKISLHKLVLQSIHRAQKPSLVSVQAVFIAGALIEDEIAVGNGSLFERLFRQAQGIFPGKGSPGQAVFLQQSIKTLQDRVHKRAAVHRGEFVEVPFFQVQAITKMLEQQAFCARLHAADPAHDPVSI